MEQRHLLGWRIQNQFCRVVWQYVLDMVYYIKPKDKKD